MAALLNGREYGSEITREEAVLAKASGLVVVFGYSDDNVELRGAISDEAGCYRGRTFYVRPDGIDTSGDGEKLIAEWCKEPRASWTYSTDVPHATFNIMENGELYCRGIVFAVADLVDGGGK